MGKSLYLARPIRNEAQCVRCHGSPASAPQSMLSHYGSDNGFGWQSNEVVGAQVVSVPFASASANAGRVFRALMISTCLSFAAAFLLMNAMLYVLVVRPVRHIARVADRLSLGDVSVEEFPQHGASEITSVTRSFSRMRKSLEKALRLLEN
jgi:protein-histidine pros-kinase